MTDERKDQVAQEQPVSAPTGLDEPTAAQLQDAEGDLPPPDQEEKDEEEE